MLLEEAVKVHRSLHELLIQYSQTYRNGYKDAIFVRSYIVKAHYRTRSRRKINKVK